MLIGKNFEKIQIQLGGLTITEPNIFLTDMLMAAVSGYFAYKMYSKKYENDFFKNWYYFFLIFGISSFLGGISHALFNYLKIWGKIPSLVTGIMAILYIERAMIYHVPDEQKRKRYLLLANSKFWLILMIIAVIIATLPMDEKPQLSFLPVAFDTILGLILSTGFLGYKHTKNVNREFRFFYIGVLIMIPSAFVFLLKINLHPWFDKNDLSHLLLITGCIFFYLGTSKLHKEDLATV